MRRAADTVDPMFVPYLKLPAAILLTALLVFNLTQRRHLDHGEGKRYASLGIAGIFLLFYASLVVIDRYALGEWLVAPVLFVCAVLAHAYRKRLFVFRRSCTSCGGPIPLERILYHDGSLCSSCADAAVPEKVAESDWKVHTVDDVDWESWEFTEHAVLCYIRTEGRLLLIVKKTGLGAGKVDAPGGRIEDGEEPSEAAVRECREEIGVTPTGLVHAATVSFVFTNGYSLHGTVFTADSYEGTPKETAEADPFWCTEDSIPYDRMWEDEREWVPAMLAGRFVRGYFIFNGESMISKRLAYGRGESRG